MYDITNKDRAWYAVAKKVAAESSALDRHGCVLVKAGAVLAIATNRIVISHPISERYDKRTLHAEQRLLLKAINPSGSTLYSARDHINAASYPCDMCYALLFDAGVARVMYNDGAKLMKVDID